MMRLKEYAPLILIMFFCGCAGAPAVVPGKGAIYGTVAANAHKLLREKAAKNVDVEYSIGGEIAYTKEMVNYPALDELYVCLIGPGQKNSSEHVLSVSNAGMSPRSLVLAPGDKVRIRNNTSRTHTFFAAEASDDGGFQGFPPLKPGSEGSYTINLVGDLELTSEEDERITASVLSRRGLVGQRHSSGSPYSFEKLAPGNYTMLFWFWRLGYIQHQVNVQAGKNIELNETLSVDRLIK